MLTLKIGIDVDNTILDFSEAIVRAASEVFQIPLEKNSTKSASSLRIKELVGNEVWTSLQGFVYAEYSRFASVFDGSLETISKMHARGDEVLLISHKSRRPASGRLVNLHEWTQWALERNGILDIIAEDYGSQSGILHLCETLEDKLRAIVSQECSVFIDDLYKVLEKLPSTIRKIHIFCDGNHPANATVECHANWVEVSKSLG